MSPDLAGFEEWDRDEHTGPDDHDDEFAYVLHVTITLDLPGGWSTTTIAVAALIEVLDRLEHDGLRPYRTTMDITETPTT